MASKASAAPLVSPPPPPRSSFNVFIIYVIMEKAYMDHPEHSGTSIHCCSLGSWVVTEPKGQLVVLTRGVEISISQPYN